MNISGAQSLQSTAFVFPGLFLHIRLQVEKWNCKIIVSGTAVSFVSAKKQGFLGADSSN